MAIKNFVVLDSYFENAILDHIKVTKGVMYTASKDDGEGVHFPDDTGESRYMFYETVQPVYDDVQNPDEDVPVVPVPDPAIHHPSHYNQGGIECIDAIRSSMSLEAFRGFLKGNQLKYLWRYESKGKAAEDIGKSNWYGAELEKSLKGEPTQ